MTGFIVSVFPFRNRVSPKEAFEGLELGEGKPSRPVLRGPRGRKAAWLLDSYLPGSGFFADLSASARRTRSRDFIRWHCSSKFGRGPFQRRALTESKTGTSSRRGARLRKRKGSFT